MTLPLPRNIAPENIEIGDTIRVVFKVNKGVVMTHEGTVSERKDQGSVRTLYTDEGGTLFAWEPGRHNLTVTLLNRPPMSQATLPGLDEIRDRIE